MNTETQLTDRPVSNHPKRAVLMMSVRAGICWQCTVHLRSNADGKGVHLRHALMSLALAVYLPGVSRRFLAL